VWCQGIENAVDECCPFPTSGLTAANSLWLPLAIARLKQRINGTNRVLFGKQITVESARRAAFCDDPLFIGRDKSPGNRRTSGQAAAILLGLD